MTIEAKQIRDNVIRPVLTELTLWSASAELLVWGTGAFEGDGFDAIRQYGGGPALSWFGIEPATYRDLLERTLPGLARTHGALVAAYQAMTPKRYAGYPPAEHLLRDIGFACATCRLLYFRAPGALPNSDDLFGLAAYWKRWYNTPAGAGKPEQWIASFRRYCN